MPGYGIWMGSLIERKTSTEGCPLCKEKSCDAWRRMNNWFGLRFGLGGLKRSLSKHIEEGKKNI